MRTKRAYLVIFPVLATVTLVTSCVARGAAVNTDNVDVSVVARSEAVGVKSSPLDTALPDKGVIVDRAPHATRTPLSLSAGPEGAVDPVLSTPTPEPMPASADSPAELGAADVSSGAQPASAASAPGSHEPAAATADGAVVLVRVPDVDPAPPFVVLVDSVRLVDGGATYKVTGWVRNESGVTYESVGLEATFYDGSDWHFGPFDATCGCYTLEPGQSCAFSVEAHARDYTGFRLHPEGSPGKAWTGSSTAIAVGDAVVAGTEAGYVRLTGVVQNQTGSTVNTVRVSAALVGSDGAVTGVGTMIMAGELAPGAEASFSLRIPADVYASYTITAEAELQ